MFDYNAEREKRARRFEKHLQQLVEYRQAERSTDIALVFSTRRLSAASASRVAVRHRCLASTSAAGAGHRASTATLTRERPERFVQFAFLKQTFYLDLPRATLSPAEAAHLLHRPGFFRLSDRRWWFQSFDEWRDVVRLWSPVEKEYLNADVRSAADELAYLFYGLWHYPLETRLYWQAMCFRCRKARPWEGTGRLS